MAFGLVVLTDGTRADDLLGASRVEVVERIGAPTTFALRYPVFNVEGDLEPLKALSFAPGADLAVFQRATGFNECLVKGQVYSHQVRLVHGVGGSYVDVVGADSSLQMDRETKLMQWADNTTDSDAVTNIVSSYGFVPEVETTETRYLEDNRTLIQHDTDLNFVHMLARRNGYLFWVRSDPALVETAYFQPPPLEEAEPIELLINVENSTLDWLNIDWDVERPTSVLASALDGAAKTVIDGSGAPPPPTFPGDQPLSAIAGEARSASLVAAVTDQGDLLGRATGLLLDASWFITATCATSARRLNRIVRAHTVVKVDGAGKRYSGNYLVAAVRHVIDEHDHTMEITLLRNGWPE
ncbi:MAG: hypothetical protein IPK19_00885 [Chloroflexi bacterium]|nr:hypothetical protein [Chloroflexota bacterium]